MITQEQFLAGMKKIVKKMPNQNIDILQGWYEDFAHWDLPLFTAVIKQAHRRIDFLTIKALYDLAEEIHKEYYQYVQFNVDGGPGEYEENIQRMMEGWMCPDRETVFSFLPDDHPFVLQKAQDRVELEEMLNRRAIEA